MVTLEDLLEIIRDYNPEEEEIITKAYYFAEEHFKGKFRDSGEPFITHPLFVAMMAAKFLKADRDFVIACLLHDTIEDCKDVKLTDIEQLFGAKVVFMVDGVTRDPSFNTGDKEKEQLLNEQRLLKYMVQDIRVFLIKVLDRIHNLITLNTLKGEEKKKRKAKESLDFYVRLLDAFGMNEFKLYMDDLGLINYDQTAYEKISKDVYKIRKESEIDIRKVLDIISEKLNKNGIEFELLVKTKSINDIYRKQIAVVDIRDIYNLLAIKVIVKKPEDCYTAAEIIDQYYPIIKELSMDYIPSPKGNGYQALHITSWLNRKMHIQFRIKTFDMEAKSRYGISNYWFAFKGKAPEKMLETLEQECDMFQKIKQIVTSDGYNEDDVKRLNRILNEI